MTLIATYNRNKEADQEYYVVLTGTNGEVILTSEMYASLAGAQNLVSVLRSNGLNVAVAYSPNGFTTEEEERLKLLQQPVVKDANEEMV